MGVLFETSPLHAIYDVTDKIASCSKWLVKRVALSDAETIASGTPNTLNSNLISLDVTPGTCTGDDHN